MDKKGKFIVFYGINNLGKSTQVDLLLKKLKEKNIKIEVLKYPIYDLAPSGPIINDYLRNGNPFNLTAREVQMLYAKNRFQFEPLLIKKLESGINIIAEDYVGTGLAWGIGAGVDEKFLKLINQNLLQEDLAFLFDGERFMKAQEKNHKHETNNDLTDQVRKIHLRLGKEFNWKKINANTGKKKIHKILLTEIEKILM